MSSEKCKKCGKDATAMCINCKNAFYCSKECQKVDWKVHKTECRLFEIENDKKIGRLLKANRDIEAGTVIISEMPVVVGPKWSDEGDEASSKFSCVGCFETIQNLFHKCNNCFWPACSPECIGLTNAELHDIECEFLKVGKGPARKTDIKSIEQYFRSDVLLVLKILLLQRKSPRKFKQIMEMECNAKNRLLTNNYKEAEEKILFLEENFLKPLAKAEEKNKQIILPLKDKKILHKIFGIIETNAIYINLQTGTEICGLFPTTALLQHNCLPNVTYQFNMKNGFKISVKAARKIKKGENLSTSYTHVLWPTSVRQQHLADTKYFTCSCARCSDPTELDTNFSTLRCIGSDEQPCNAFQIATNPTSLSNNEYACTKCAVKVSMDNVGFITGKMNDEIDLLLNSNPNISDIEELIEKLSPFLHPNHYLLFNLKNTLVQLYGYNLQINSSILEKKLNMCNELLKIVDTLDPFSIRIAYYKCIILYEKSQCLSEMKKLNFAVKNDEAKTCLELAKKIVSNEEDTAEGKQMIQKLENALMKL